MRFAKRLGRTKAVIAAALCCGAALLCPGAAHAAFEQQAAATKAYALQALAAYQTMGREAAAQAFMDPRQWLQTERYYLHVAALSDDHIVWADSGFPELIGMNYNDIAGLDGAPIAARIWEGLQQSPAGTAIQLMFADPVGQTLAHAEGYCLRADARNVLCAWSETTEMDSAAEREAMRPVSPG